MKNEQEGFGNDYGNNLVRYSRHICPNIIWPTYILYICKIKSVPHCFPISTKKSDMLVIFCLCVGALSGVLNVLCSRNYYLKCSPEKWFASPPCSKMEMNILSL